MNHAAWILAIFTVPVLALWARTQLRQVARAVPDPADPPVLATTPRSRRTWSQAGLASLQLDVDQRRRPPAPPAPSLPQVRVVPVAISGGDDHVYEVACSFCGVLSARVLEVAAEEEATWHRLRGIHLAQPVPPAPTQEH